MRILTAHDAKGYIHEVVISQTDAPPATVTTDTGLLVTEVEAPGEISGLDLSDPERSRRQLDKVVQQLQGLRVQIGKSKLVREK